MSRDQDKFNIVYVGDCEKTDEESFFTQHSRFKCWVQQSRSEKSLYLAILPMFESTTDYRKNIINKIKTRYKPTCNFDDTSKVKPDYVIRKTGESTKSETHICSSCGSEMKSEQIEKSTVFRCTNCKSSNT